MLETLVQQLGRDLQMEKQIVNPEPGHFTLPFENDVRIEAFQKENYSLLKSQIENLPTKNSEAFVEKIMEANLYTHGTRGTLIGLNAEGDKLTLSMEISNNSSYKDFFEKLEDFITVLDYWRTEAKK
jgi:hypothetical protein